MNDTIAQDYTLDLAGARTDTLDLASRHWTRPEVLADIARNKDPHVRRVVASNPNAPIEVLTLLAGDSNGQVRIHVANNPSTPADVLTLLAADDDEYVRWFAARRLLSPADRVTFDALDADGWPFADLDGLLATVAVLAA